MACTDEDEVIREGFMIKRSQNKKIFTPVNYKGRWFVLTRRALTYYDTEGQKRKERGRIPTDAIHTVEQAQLGELSKQIPTDGDNEKSPAYRYPFQVGYTEQGSDYTLYLAAREHSDRLNWIHEIRKLCISNTRRVRYHPAVWAARKWTCCDAERRSAPGCALAAGWPLPEPDFELILHDHKPINENTLAVTAAVTMPGGGGAPPGTPSAKLKDKQRTKVVVALYPFKAIESGDLSLEKGAEYEVIDDSQEHWWKVKDENGSVGYIPSNYVKEKETIGLQKYEWYVGEMSRQRAESLLKQEDKEGCFVVRNSSTKGMYTLSLYTKVNHPQTKHYHIKQNARGEFYLSDKHCCSSIPELINYHKHNSGGLCSRLKATPCDRPAPPTAGLSHDKWEIDPSELVLLEELGAGQFGVVRRGRFRGSTDTAVKMMKEGTMSEDDFIDEAKVMTKLQHPNLVQLYGVCSKHRPIYIVTEYMRHGSLFNYLRRTPRDQLGSGVLLDMCIQVCKGMTYLEKHNYIHRDLAARNCLVAEENVVKVADFGLARYVLDDQYTSSGGTKFPIKWAPPEVLNYTRFSSKSDVWAFGVLMWEVFTCGKVPYGKMKNSEVVEMVQKGHVLEKPKDCLNEIYNVMKACWRHLPEERPSFRLLKEELAGVAHSVLAD
ncbi:tyrosine-protein kinase Btk isoform X1 [Maniola hyperantus]|uniref:tyrosine-protein kinase Btk isoform X1 n=2 Tax=Aphantopus hyperantus TaxID=2795564 RepID=UPI00156A05C5|nr:tyrosine-protein kinase Btk29A isoform X1 [Maniola hyperantus]XP_034825105.1 tyrosine-protein kinase Btk29A isoform X1 [Maniola hyperantus]